MFNDEISLPILQIEYNTIFTDKIAPDNVIIDKAQEAFGLVLQLNTVCTDGRGMTISNPKDAGNAMQSDDALHFIVCVDFVFYNYKTGQSSTEIPDEFRQLFVDRESMEDYYEALVEDFFDTFGLNDIPKNAATDMLENEIDIIEWSKIVKQSACWYFYDKLTNIKDTILRHVYYECIRRKKDIQEWMYGVYEELHDLSLERSLFLIGSQGIQRSKENPNISNVVENAPWGTAFMWFPDK